MKYIVTITLFVLLGTPLLAIAQEQQSPEVGVGTYESDGYDRTESYDGISGLVQCQENCGWNDLVAMVNRIVRWLVSMLAIVAVIGMVVAGFRMVTSGGDEQAWTDAKKMFTNVVIGLIIVLAAWLIVDTLLATLTECGGLNRWLDPGSCAG